MFLFLIAAIPVAVGAYVLGEVAKDVNTKVTSNNTAETITKEKKNITKNGESVIGIIDPTLTQKSTTLLGLPTTLTVDKFDTTTYADRAVIKLTNNNGYITFLRGLAIKGKLVTKLAGKNGYVWEYSDYESIEKEGEKFVEVSNDFIFSPSQAKNIGDFVWKELKPHKMYALGLVGTHYEYEIGDVYHLTLTHTMNSGTMENIDTDVEVMGVTLNRSVGGVGSTVLNLRVPSEAWALTLAKNAKLVGAANAQRLNNRSNVVTVASKDWTGQADYFCDGASDEVEIQAAIDYVYAVGGGTVYLTNGDFLIKYTITIPDNIEIIGRGVGTRFLYDRNGLSRIFYIQGSNILLTGFSIDGQGVLGSGPAIDYNNSYAIANITISYVEVKNLSDATLAIFTPVGINVIGAIVQNCYIHDFNSALACYGIETASRVSYCVVKNIISTGAQGYGLNNCKKCQQNISTGCSTANYNNAYADSGTANACADTAAGGYNS